MDEVEVDFGHTYMVTVFNLPKPENGDKGKGKSIAIPSKLPPDLDEDLFQTHMSHNTCPRQSIF